jgi:hypothetical protein
MPHCIHYPSNTDQLGGLGDKARSGLAPSSITVTDGPFTETKELIGSRARLGGRRPATIAGQSCEP